MTCKKCGKTITAMGATNDSCVAWVCFRCNETYPIKQSSE